MGGARRKKGRGQLPACAACVHALAPQLLPISNLSSRSLMKNGCSGYASVGYWEGGLTSLRLAMALQYPRCLPKQKADVAHAWIWLKKSTRTFRPPSPNPYRGQKSQIWLRFLIPIAFEVFRFRNDVQNKFGSNCDGPTTSTNLKKNVEFLRD